MAFDGMIPRLFTDQVGNVVGAYMHPTPILDSPYWIYYVLLQTNDGQNGGFPLSRWFFPAGGYGCSNDARDYDWLLDQRDFTPGYPLSPLQFPTPPYGTSLDDYR